MMSSPAAVAASDTIVTPTRDAIHALFEEGDLVFADDTGLILRRPDGKDERLLDASVERVWSDIATLPGGEMLVLAWPRGVALFDMKRREIVGTLELSTLAKHAYEIAQAFNSFYHTHKVVQESDDAVRSARVAIIRRYHDGMVELLGLMGLSVPERM